MVSCDDRSLGGCSGRGHKRLGEVGYRCATHWERLLGPWVMDHWSRYEVNIETGCWNWTGPKDRDGYGRVDLAGHCRAHRAFYERYAAPIPEGLQIDHLCRNRGCVNPDHLEAVTRRENILRGICPSAIAARVTHCPKGHPYDEENTYIGPRGRRECRACHTEGSRRRYQAKKAAA